MTRAASTRAGRTFHQLKLQTPSSNLQARTAVWYLELGISLVFGAWCLVFPQPLSTPFHKYDPVCCVDFRFWRGATREHPPQWGCDRGATKPEPKSDATPRAAVLFGPDLVAHSLQTPEGYARRSRLVWAKNPSPQPWSYLRNGVLSTIGPRGKSLSRLECELAKGAVV